MSALDTLKGWFGAKPKAGSAEHAQKLFNQAFEAYRLAKRNRPNEDFQPNGYSGDSAIMAGFDMMNRRARDMIRNTPQGKGVRAAFQDLIVGTGFQTFSWPFAPQDMLDIVTELRKVEEEDELGPRLQFALESDDWFERWSSDPGEFDTEGRLSRDEMERMAMGECVTTGNALIIRNFRPDYEVVPLSYQIVEREQLDTSFDRPATDTENRIVGGIEFDRNNRAVAYHLFEDHPHEFFGTTGIGSAFVGTSGVVPHSLGEKRVRVPAERVIDLCLWDRPSSSIGATWYDASGSSTWDRFSYMDSEIRSAAVDAAIAFAAYLEDGEKYGGFGFADGKSDEDEFGNRSFALGHSPLAAILGKGEKLEVVRSTRPNKDAPAFIRLLDSDQARGYGLSYFTFTGDYQGSNFTSTRGAKLDEELHIKPLQRWFGTHVALRIRREFNQVAAASGLYRSLRPSQFASDMSRYQRFDAIGNGRDLLDPWKEGEARTARLRTGMSTFKEECAKRGQHWIHVLMQIALERKVSKLFGVALDFSKAGMADGQGQNEQAEQIAEMVAMYSEAA